MCTHNLCFKKIKENYKTKSTENFQVLQFRENLYITWACFGNVLHVFLVYWLFMFASYLFIVHVM